MEKIIFHRLILVRTINFKYVHNHNFSTLSKPTIMLMPIIFFIYSASIIDLIIDSFFLNSLNIFIANIGQHFDWLVNINKIIYIYYSKITFSDITTINHFILNHHIYHTNIVDNALTGLFILAVIPYCIITIRHIVKEIIYLVEKNNKIKLSQPNKNITYYEIWDSHKGKYDIDEVGLSLAYSHIF